MSLRTRIAAAAGLAVAAGRRGRRAGGLPRRARRAARRGRRTLARRRSSLPSRRGDPGAAAPGRRRPTARPAPFGGAAAYIQVVSPGRTRRAPRRRARLAARGRGVRARSPAAGEGQDLRDVTVDGVHLRVLTAALPDGRRGPGGAPARRRSIAQLDRIVLVLLAGRRLRRRPRRRRSARSSRAPRSHRSSASRAAPRQLAADPDPSERIEVRGHDELARLARQLQLDARRARALGRGAAPARGRREPRAAHADREPAGEHPDARGRRAPARGRARRAARPTSCRSSTS